MINAAISDVPADMTTAMHLCRGNFQSTFVASGGYEPVAEILFNEYRERRFAPPPLMKRMVLAGMYGRKSGKGFYVQLHPKPSPYGITYETGNSAVKHLRKGHDGRCFRVHGGSPGGSSSGLIPSFKP